MDNLKMLPEYLFTVGHSMQDISRDDFSILNEGDVAVQPTEKDMCPTPIYRIQNTSPFNSNATNLPKALNNEDNAAQSFATVKLEDINTNDLFPSHPSTWQQHPLNACPELGHHRMFINTHNRFENNNAKLLLQGSDDPLISHGANTVLSHDDEHPADFAKNLNTPPNHHLQNTVNNQSHQEELPKLSNQQTAPQRLVKSGCSNLTKQQLKVKANLMSARNQQQQQIQKNTSSLNTSTIIPSTVNQKPQRSPKTKNKKGTTVKLRFHHQALPAEYLSHYEATQGQQRLQSKNLPKLNTSKSSNNLQKQSQPRNSHENVRSWLKKIAEMQRTANASKETAIQTQKQIQKHQCQPSTDKKFESLKSTTLIPTDVNTNSQIQSGHKAQTKSSLTLPATHDNHLTAEVNNYSNSKRSCYSDLPYMGEITLDNWKPRRGRKPKKADICHLIYKNYGTILPKKTKPANSYNYSSPILNMEIHNNRNEGYEQPLNLCLRDQLNDTHSISSGDELSETNSSCPTPVSNPQDYVRDSMLANSLKNSLNNINEKNKDENALKTTKKPSTSTSQENVMHPITMYYQQLLESGVLLHNANGPIKTIQKDNQLALKIPIPSGLFLPQTFEKSTTNAVASNLEYPEPLSTPSSIKSDTSLATTISSATNQQQIAPQKRKRSAIFIPPMNVENTTNPVTEVSICKFKFTGGSKPTLQEKKMVSVDAGGNYRYFSGTGDKASRGYEYFPRECLQHTAGLLPGVNCTGQKLAIDVPPPSAGLSNDFLQIPESPTSPALPLGRSINGNTLTDAVSPKSTSTSYEVSKNEACSNYIKENSSYSSSSPTTLLINCSAVQRKNNIIQQQLKKSSQREKLEKTFKEQGFLIQTQKLESAEGATYCKFRQLNKFTRYLFRNWKEYLPDELQENTNAAALISVTDTPALATENVDDKAT